METMFWALLGSCLNGLTGAATTKLTNFATAARPSGL